MSRSLKGISSLLAVCAASLGVATLAPSAAHASGSLPAARQAPSGGILYLSTSDDMLHLANANGKDAHRLPFWSGQVAAGPYSWAPDGSRIALAASATQSNVDTVTTLSASGTNVRQFPSAPARNGNLPSAIAPTYVGDGSYIVYEANTPDSYPQLYLTTSDGNQPTTYLFGRDTHACDTSPSSDGGELLIFDRGPVSAQGACTGAATIYLRNMATGVLRAVTAGRQPSIAPHDARIAFVRAVRSAGGSYFDQIFVANLDGSHTHQVTSGNVNHDGPTWSPDGTRLAYSDITDSAVDIRTLATGATISIAAATSPAWQPAVDVDNHVVQVAGHDNVTLSIAASQLAYRTYGVPDARRAKAGAVVLGSDRDDRYSLNAPMLAATKHAPILLNGPAGLDPRIRTEIGRVLGHHGTVCLLGDTRTLSAGLQATLTRLGYRTVRIAGADQYSTAVAVDGQLTQRPLIVFVADGSSFADPLDTGSVGGGPYTLALSDGSSLPSATVGYLNTLDPRKVVYVAIGGGATTALRNARLRWPGGWRFYYYGGANVAATSLSFAAGGTTANADIVLASTENWVSELLGGSVAAPRLGAVILTDPRKASPALLYYLSIESASLSDVQLMGGGNVLLPALVTPVGDAMGLPGHFDYSTFEAGDPVPAASGTPASSPLDRLRHTAAPAVNGATSG